MCRLSADFSTVYLSHNPEYAVNYGFKLHSYWFALMVSFILNIFVCLMTINLKISLLIYLNDSFNNNH